MKVHVTSLGCVRNLVDTEVLMGDLVSAGCTIISDAQEADILVVNTCGFLSDARKEAITVLKELDQIKKKEAQVVVTGCMLPLHSDLLKKHFPNFILLPLNQQHLFVSKLGYEQKNLVKRLLATPPHYAYLKVAEGCMKACSFCLIPKIKGRLISRSKDSIVREFKELLERGVFEIILVAQDLSDYGKDRKEKNALSELLKELLKINQHFWLRLLYLYPDGIDNTLLSVMASDPRICPYFDIPMQHINDDLLKKMKRKTSRGQIIEVIEKIHTKFPYSAIRTSLIVGFPTEKEEHVLELAAFLKTYALDHVGFFPYSPEKGTEAYKFSDQCSKRNVVKRLSMLTSLQQKIVEEKNKKIIGHTFDVIADSFHSQSRYLVCGRTQLQCPEVDGCIIINDISPIDAFGQCYRIKITDIAGHDLVGQVSI